MIRAVGFFILITLIALFAAWVADIPGTVTIALQDREMRMNLPTAAGVIIVLTILTITAYRIISAFVAAPAEFFRWRAMGKRRKGFAALTRGLVAVAAGTPPGKQLLR